MLVYTFWEIPDIYLFLVIYHIKNQKGPDQESMMNDIHNVYSYTYIDHVYNVCTLTNDDDKVLILKIKMAVSSVSGN